MERILPTKHLIQIKIRLSDVKQFNEIFPKKVFDFYCIGKEVSSGYMIVNARAMRINEFLKVIIDHSLEWSSDDL